MASTDQEMPSAQRKHLKKINAIIASCEKLSVNIARQNFMEEAETFRKLLNEKFDSNEQFMARYQAIKTEHKAFCRNLNSRILATFQERESIRKHRKS